MVLPYEVSGTKKQKARLLANGAGFARVCAACDAIGAWPRFSHIIDVEEED